MGEEIRSNLGSSARSLGLGRADAAATVVIGSFSTEKEQGQRFDDAIHAQWLWIKFSSATIGPTLKND